MSARWLAAVSLAVGLSVSPGRAHPLETATTDPDRCHGNDLVIPDPAVAFADAQPPEAAAPPSFVRAAAEYRGRLWIGTFNAGLYVAELSPETGKGQSRSLSHVSAVPTPFRMVNDALATHGSLYVAANEGLFVTPDGTHFTRVREVSARGVTAIATDGHALYATTASALWRVRLDRHAAGNATWWKPGGSRSLQGLVVEQDSIWLASEDRGVIRFDGRTFATLDRLAGLPTSWVVAIAGDGRGGVLAATLRHGAIHIDSSGRWKSLDGLPSEWTLSIARAEGEVCVGTQEGASCYDEAGATAGDRWEPSRRLLGLPDERVHGLLPVRDGWLVATQSGAVVLTRSS